MSKEIYTAMTKVMETRKMEKDFVDVAKKTKKPLKNESDYGVIFEKPEKLSLCIRGTGGESGFIQSLQGWIRNFKIRRQKAENYYTQKHRGFKKSSLFFLEMFKKELKNHKFNIKKIELIGFSAGGGIVQCMLSQIIDEMMKRKGRKPHINVYLFASPNAIAEPSKLPFYPFLSVKNIRNEGDFIAGIGSPLYKNYGEVIEMKTNIIDKIRGISWVHNYDCYLRNCKRRLKNGK